MLGSCGGTGAMSTSVAESFNAGAEAVADFLFAQPMPAAATVSERITREFHFIMKTLREREASPFGRRRIRTGRPEFLIGRRRPAHEFFSPIRSAASPACVARS